jgi:hypothetical protein
MSELRVQHRTGNRVLLLWESWAYKNEPCVGNLAEVQALGDTPAGC